MNNIYTSKKSICFYNNKVFSTITHKKTSYEFKNNFFLHISKLIKYNFNKKKKNVTSWNFLFYKINKKNVSSFVCRC